MGEIISSAIAVADTHFGLWNPDQGCDPLAFAEFLNWIKDLESGKEESLKLGYWASTNSENASVDFQPPEKLIFLGDILELWDSRNETIFSSIIGILQILFELNCHKIYILGNHDNDLAYLSSFYPLGNSILEIREENYLTRIGNELYYFFHGHQLDKKFSLSTWKAFPSIRNIGYTFSYYSLIFLALFFAEIALIALGLEGSESILLGGFFFAMFFPFFFIKFARGFWNNFRTVKYNPDYASNHALINEKILKTYEKWSYKLNIVYGHTHAIDSYNPTDVGKVDFSILNLPSWVRDFRLSEGTPLTEESIEKEISHVFLYITEEFCGFVGWDSLNKKPFYIPHEVIFEKRKNGNLSKFEMQFGNYLINHQNIEEELERIGWPKDLIKKWMTGFTTGVI